MLKSIKNVEIVNKKVLLRLDLNVPIHDKKIQSDFRIKKSIPTILYLLSKNNKVIILSHLGRPEEGKSTPDLSLKKISEHLSNLLNYKVKFIENWVDGFDIENENIIMCENVRFQIGEKENSAALSKKIASLGDVYVFDAFGVAHRKEASTFGITEFLDSYAGLLIEEEISATNKMIHYLKSPSPNNTQPLVAIISGAKVSTKLKLINSLISKDKTLHADVVLLGGGILNTFLAAMGYCIGLSLHEKSFVHEAKKIIEKSYFNEHVLLPIDVVCSDRMDFSNPQNKHISMIQSKDRILDIGEATIKKYVEFIEVAHPLFWNGPLGYIEKPPYDQGTINVAKAIDDASKKNEEPIENRFSIVGGGETISIIEKLGIQDKISWLSTGGGSLLKHIVGDELPILKKLGT